MRYVIVTGTSQGLGKALVETLADTDTTVFAIARKEAEKRNNVVPILLDLQKIESIDGVMRKIFQLINFKNATTIVLISNAGVLQPIKSIDKCTTAEIRTSVEVNLLAPMVLVSSFIKYAKEYTGEKRIINISTGENPYAGWGCYSSTKAGVRMFVRAVALEQEKEVNPVKILSFKPSVMDTSMQQSIRETKKEDFAKLDKFLALKKEHKLLPPQVVAEKVKQILFAQEFPSGEIVNLEDLL